MATDRELQESVFEALGREPLIESAEIGVTVVRGVVTLSGTVPTFDAREAAEAAALRVPGVQDVSEQLVTCGNDTQRTDGAIAHAVRRALQAHLPGGNTAIKTCVSHGVVALRGSVDSWQSAVEAEAAVGELPGVQEVVDELTVGRPTFDAGALEVEVSQALDHCEEHPLHGIQVSVDDGIVTLSGPIRSWDERDKLVEAARLVPGVQAVRDHLHLSGYQTEW
jgi:osmotically-inducible protein OsmY